RWSGLWHTASDLKIIALNQGRKVSLDRCVLLKLRRILLFNKNCPKCVIHHIQSLTPFLDSKGLIRVGGRLSNSKYRFDKCHPVLICGKHRLAKLIFAREHIRLVHARPQQMLAAIRERVWVTAGRNIAKQIVHQCVKCFRAAPKEINPIMANLPLARRWSREYITELQQRTKWRAQGRNLEKGAMVLVKEDNLPTSLWRIGRVVEVYPGPDGINRVAVIKTINGNIKRGFAKICPLPIYDNTTTSTDSEVI
ncbi:hypothetical protein PPYR_14995, partial [Photinus pyralis]